MPSVFNLYTVEELLNELENEPELAQGECSYYIENGVIMY